MNLYSDNADHCGSCNYRCSEQSKENATSNACVDGACQYQCDEDFVNVGNGVTADTIKCIDPKNTKEFCGAESYEKLGKPCSKNESCVNGKCIIHSCESPYTLCDINGANSCVNTQSNDANHCGTCNYSCSKHRLLHATSDKCAGGECQYTCESPFVNVGNGSIAETIECIDPMTNHDHCGALGYGGDSDKTEALVGTNCGDDRICVNGECTGNNCTNNSETMCSVSGTLACINLNGDNANHCGTCNYTCSAHPMTNAKSSACSSGKCQYECSIVGGVQYVNVGSGITADTILCINPQIDSEHCGAKGNSNGAATTDDQKGTACGSGKVCVGGNCVYNSCTDNSETLCSTKSGNICINIHSDDAFNCGACGFECPQHLSHAYLVNCVEGKCYYDCVGGYTTTNHYLDNIDCVLDNQ